MPGWLNVRDTVAIETPARAATSTIPGAPFLDFGYLIKRILSQNENVCIFVFIR
jgi:hypothetical protein